MAEKHLDGSDALVDLPHIKITFQHGAAHEAGVNGCRVEDVVQVLVEKLIEFQGRSMRCPENDVAIDHLTQARSALERRRRAREQQGVLGTLVPHGPS